MARYKRADLTSAINAAKKVSQNSTAFVFATYQGYHVATSAPAFQSYYKVHQSIVELVEYHTGCPKTDIDWAAERVKLEKKAVRKAANQSV